MSFFFLRKSSTRVAKRNEQIGLLRFFQSTESRDKNVHKRSRACRLVFGHQSTVCHAQRYFRWQVGAERRAHAAHYDIGAKFGSTFRNAGLLSVPLICETWCARKHAPTHVIILPEVSVIIQTCTRITIAPFPKSIIPTATSHIDDLNFLPRCNKNRRNREIISFFSRIPISRRKIHGSLEKSRQSGWRA